MDWGSNFFISFEKIMSCFYKKLFLNTFKIVISTVIMSIVLVIALEKYSYYLNYTYTYKSIYLLIIRFRWYYLFAILLSIRIIKSKKTTKRIK